MTSFVAEFEVEERACPCCGHSLPLGLFSRPALVKNPLAVRGGQTAGASIQEDTGMITMFGRSFLAVRANLPLSWAESPIQVGSWIECDVRYRTKLEAARDGKGEACHGHGWLAADLPGFPGSIGAAVRFSIKPGQITPQLRVVEDTRISALTRHLTHDELVVLYRQTWGNNDAVIEADPALRNALYQAWADRVGREIYRQPIAPPPPVSGIMPAELLIAPPRDTGEEAAIATIGCAEAARQPSQPVELMSWIRNPGQQFLNSFAEFCYLTRMSRPHLDHGALISERMVIPESNDMSSWLICRPWWESEEWAELSYQEHKVHLLAAIPLCRSEKEFAERRGTRELLQAFERSSVDLADLQRDSCLLM